MADFTEFEAERDIRQYQEAVSRAQGIHQPDGLWRHDGGGNYGAMYWLTPDHVLLIVTYNHPNKQVTYHRCTGAPGVPGVVRETFTGNVPSGQFPPGASAMRIRPQTAFVQG